MDSTHFDALTRSFPALQSRRGVLTALSGGLLTFLTATLAGQDALAAKQRDKRAAATKKRHKKPCPPCKTRKQGKCKGQVPDGSACNGGTCQGGACLSSPCVPQDSALVCAAGCGTRSDTCGGAVTCPCPAGQGCLTNGTCATTCDPVAQLCPTTCRCVVNSPSAEAAVLCIPNAVVSCAQVPQACTSTAACPPGQACLLTQCGPGDSDTLRCVPVCPA